MLEDLIRLLTFLTVVLRTHGGPHGAEPNERHGRRAPGRRSEQLCSHPRLCAALPGEGGLHRQQHAPGGARHANRRAGPTSCGGGPHVLPQHCHIGLRGWVEKVAGVYWHFFIDCRGGDQVYRNIGWWSCHFSSSRFTARWGFLCKHMHFSAFFPLNCNM